MSGSNRKRYRFPERMNRWIIVILIAILVAGPLFTWWIVQRTEENMRGELLQEAKLIERTINIDRIKLLKGDARDLGSREYQRLKEHLMTVRVANDKCRFLYLMGRKGDGSIFIYVDSEPVGSKDYSPPGQLYSEVSTKYKHVFDSGIPAVVGPVKDRWGTWISALVPMIDHSSGTLQAVMGMDIDAGIWNKSIASMTVIPVALLILLITAGALGILTAFSRSELHKNERLLRWKTALLEAQMNATIDGMMVIGQIQKRLSINQRLVDMLNIPENIIEDEDNTSLLLFIAGVSKDPQAFIEKTVYLENHPDEVHSYEIELKNGVILETYSAPVIGEDGQYYGRIWTFRDVTDRRRVDAEVRHSEKLAAALEMAGAVCHELNQPLQVISARVDLLRMGKADDKTNKSLQIISDQVFRMGGITKRIMGLERYSNRKYIGDIKITDLDQQHKDDA